MATVNLIVVIESVRTLILKEGDELRKFHLPSIIAVAVALGTPFSFEAVTHADGLLLLAVKLALFIYSFSIRNQSSQVQVLWEDHRNDLFVNSFGEFCRIRSFSCDDAHRMQQVSSCPLVAVNCGGVSTFCLTGVNIITDNHHLGLDPMGALIVSSTHG